MLRIKCIAVGQLWTNSYIVWDADSMEGILVDPGDEGDRLIREIKKNEIILKQIIITHGHFDHLKDAAYVSAELKVPVLASKAELPIIKHVSEQATLFGFPPIKPPEINVYLEQGSSINVGSYTFKVLSTPGHSPGSITLYNSSEGIAIVGDLIFFESIGRTDIPGGDYNTLIQSIKKHILTMSDNTRLLPGHGEETTVGHEKLNNPFLTDEFRYEA
jgi:glyoxylase-like metal-dependent hydrolase (beta-lactamase superfamily II)